MHFRLELRYELGSLLQENVEQSPKLAVLAAFSGIPKCALAPPTCFNEIVEYGEHFVVVHKISPSKAKGAIAIPLNMSFYATVVSSTCHSASLARRIQAGTNTCRRISGSAE